MVRVEEDRADDKPQSSGQAQASPEATQAGLEQCLQLLRGQTDEQRLVGLLLVTKFVSPADTDSLRRVLDAMGWRFLNRLLASRGDGSMAAGYRQLALSIMSALCRLPEVASSNEVLTKIPLLLDTMREGSDGAQDALECMVAVCSSAPDGLVIARESGAIPAICSYVAMQAGRTNLALPVQLLGLLLNMHQVIKENAEVLASIVPIVAATFASNSDRLKFEALALLQRLLASDESACLFHYLEINPDTQWPRDVRTGVGTLLHSRVGHAQKQSSLLVAEALVQLCGVDWLSGSIEGMPANRFFQLVLETVRVEVSVLLQAEVRKDVPTDAEGLDARKLSTPPQTAPPSSSYETAETQDNDDLEEADQAPIQPPVSRFAAAPTHEQTLSACFVLLEAVIEAMSRQAAQMDVETGGLVPLRNQPSAALSNAVLMKSLDTLTTVHGELIEYLQLAKDAGIREGALLQASTISLDTASSLYDVTSIAASRSLGRFLAEAPGAYRPQARAFSHIPIPCSVLSLLDYLMSLQTADGEPGTVIPFLLPALLQMTDEEDALRAVAESGSLDKLLQYTGMTLRKAATGTYDDLPASLLACDVLNNFLSNNSIRMSDKVLLHLLPPLSAVATGQQHAWPVLAAISQILRRVGEAAAADALLMRQLTLLQLAAIDHGYKGWLSKELEEGVQASWETVVASCTEVVPLLLRFCNTQDISTFLQRVSHSRSPDVTTINTVKHHGVRALAYEVYSRSS
eukprot:jgi/Chlat1/927/Chrsp108S01366